LGPAMRSLVFLTALRIALPTTDTTDASSPFSLSELALYVETVRRMLEGSCESQMEITDFLRRNLNDEPPRFRAKHCFRPGCSCGP
jgi:hypothetical protein